jgi:hypothetical protein
MPRARRDISLVVFALASAALVALGASLIVRQGLFGPSGYGDVVYDTRFYLAMIERHWPWDASAPAAIPAPFRFRILVPWIARALPFASGRSLALVTYVSLAASYFFSLLTCRRLGLGVAASVAGVTAAFSGYAHLALYTNPYLTDATGLLVIAVMTYALVSDMPLLFATMGLAGIFAREISLVLLLIWCVRSVRRGVLFTAVAAVALAVEHVFIGVGPTGPIFGTGPNGPSPALMDAFLYFSRWRWDTRLAFAQEIIMSWGWLWLCAAIGLTLVPAESRRAVGAAALALLVAGLASLFVASDVARLLDILFPAIAVGAAFLIAEMTARTQRVWLVLLGLLIVVQFVAGWPGVLRAPRALLDVVPRLRWVTIAGAIVMAASARIVLHDRRGEA